jgi:hypothetical protein
MSLEDCKQKLGIGVSCKIYEERKVN